MPQYLSVSEHSTTGAQGPAEDHRDLQRSTGTCRGPQGPAEEHRDLQKSNMLDPVDSLSEPVSDEELDAEQDAARLRFMRERRRARSLPACTALLGDGGRKRVQFADTLGLSLADVKHFSTTDAPLVPHAVLTRHRSLQRAPQPLLVLVPCFPEIVDAQQRAQVYRVALEKVHVTQFDVRGQVLACTKDVDAHVIVRYTFNEWLSHVDTPATRLSDHCFSFSVLAPPPWSASALHFAVRLRSTDGDFWDNNSGGNYSLRYGRAHKD